MFSKLRADAGSSEVTSPSSLYLKMFSFSLLLLYEQEVRNSERTKVKQADIFLGMKSFFVWEQPCEYKDEN